MKRIIVLLHIILGWFAIFILCGCSTVYDSLPSMPKYVELREKFDTSAYIGYLSYDKNLEVKDIFLEVLKKNNYSNILEDYHVYSKPLKNRIICKEN